VFIDIDLGLILLCAVCGCSVGGFAPGNITCNAAVHQCRSLTKARCDSSGVAYRGGRPWPFSRPDQNSGVYFNSDTLEEIQIKTAGNDASVGVPGISMVAVIKSGGNAFHGLYSASAETPTLQSNNLDDRLRSQGLTAVQPVKTLRLCLRRTARHQLQQEALQTATFTWHDLNGDKLYQPGEVNLNLNGFDFVSVNGAIGNVMNPNLKQPLYSESATSYEHELAPSVGFNTSHVYRRSTDNYNIPGPNVARPLSAYNIRITRRDPGADGILGTADDGGSVTFFDYSPAYRGVAFVQNELQNSPLPNQFHTVEFTVTKRPTRRWQGSASFWMVKNHRWITSTFNAPQDYFFALDETWGWAGNFEVSYRLPFDLLVAANMQSKKGAMGQRTVLFRTVDPDGGTPISQLSTATIRMEPYGAEVGPPLNVLNFRGSKDIRVRGGKLGFGVDVFNALNSNAPNALLYASGPTYLYPTGVNGGILPARIARLTARFSF